MFLYEHLLEKVYKFFLLLNIGEPVPSEQYALKIKDNPKLYPKRSDGSCDLDLINEEYRTLSSMCLLLMFLSQVINGSSCKLRKMEKL